MHWQSGDFDAAAREMQAALAISPEYAEAHFMLGTALKQKGDLAGAEAALREAIRLSPADPGPYNTLAQVLRAEGRRRGQPRGIRARARRRSRRRRPSLGRCSRRGEGPSRRGFLRSICAALPVFTFDQIAAAAALPFQFVNVAREAGLRAKTIFGGEKTNRFLLETTGCGCAFFDYDHDGWLDIFLVNGTRFEAKWPPGQAPVSRLYKNNRDGTFTDVTRRGRGRAHRLGTGRLRGRLRQRRTRRPVRHLLGRVRPLA